MSLGFGCPSAFPSDCRFGLCSNLLLVSHSSCTPRCNNSIKVSTARQQFSCISGKERYAAGFTNAIKKELLRFR
jgi:hypothetical protein